MSQTRPGLFYRYNQATNKKATVCSRVQTVLSTPAQTPFAHRREREFLYLKEVDILIAATQNTRAGTRNAAQAMLLFCQTGQPVELCWLRWCDVDFNKNTRQVIRNRTKSSQSQPLFVNRQHLSIAEVDILKELQHLSTTDWLLQSVHTATIIGEKPTPYYCPSWH